MKRLGILLIVTALICSCGSDDINIVETRGTVIDLGDVAADGCGFVIEIDGTQYSPTYLNSQYREDGLEVFINVEFLTSVFTCGLQATEIPQIRVEQIRPVSN